MKRVSVALGAIVGLLAAGIAIGVGELVAAFVRPAASPVIAVGNRFIVLTPEPVKRWAIREFGTNDKHVLLTGIYVMIAAFAVVIGVLGIRWLWAGVAGVAVLGAVGVYCALTANAHRGSDVIPSIIGAIAGAAALVWLIQQAQALAQMQATASPQTQANASPQTQATASPQANASPRTGTQNSNPKVSPNRRVFLQGSAAAAGVAVVGGFGGRALQHARFDASKARAAVSLPTPVDAAPPLANGTDLGKSSIPFGTPNADFYRIDTALSIPQIDPKHWQLRIHGMVDKELTLTYDELLKRPMIERWITLCCVSNEVGGSLISNARFLGVRLADLLREAGVDPKADQLLATSEDGMTIGSPTAVVMDGRDAMLAVGMNGEPLPIAARLPGPDGRARAVRLRLGVQVDRRHAGHDVRQRAGVLGARRLGGEGADPPCLAHRHAAVRDEGHRRADRGDRRRRVGSARRRLEGRGAGRLRRVAARLVWRRAVHRHLAAVGAALDGADPGRAFRCGCARPTAAGCCRIRTPRDPFPSGATGYHLIQVTAQAV